MTSRAAREIALSKMGELDTKHWITDEEAREAVQRLVNSHFHQQPRARMTIPCRLEHDDDVVASSYIRQQAAYREAIEALASARASASEWRAIETAPKDGTLILAYEIGRSSARFGWHLTSWDHTAIHEDHPNGTWCDEQDGSEVDADVWMSLPSPPPTPTEGDGT